MVMTDIEDQEYCPDCDATVSYDEDGNPECDCEWEEAGDAIPQEVWLAEMKAAGEEYRHWDPEWVEIQSRNSLDKKPPRFVRKQTLGQIARIERLRWTAYARIVGCYERKTALCEEMKALPHQECFIAQNPKHLERSIAEAIDKGEPLSSEEIFQYGQPRRVVMKESRHKDGFYAHYDDDFWEYQKPKHGNNPMEVIAAAAHLGEWEQIILPDRIERAKDPAKLDLGKRYRHQEKREFRHQEWCYRANALLDKAILLSEILPRHEAPYDKRVVVLINGRQYPYKIRHNYAQPDFDHWPLPDDIDPVVVVEDGFAFDDSLIGRSHDAVRVRFGSPLKIEKNVWVYEQGCVVFSDDKNSYYTRVRAVEPIGVSLTA